MMAPKAGSAGATATATATVMDDPDKEKLQTFRSLPKLAEYCGVKDDEGFKAWLKGPLFQPTFQQLYDEAIAPQQQKASEAGKGRPRTMNAKTIESAMQLGEAYGSRMRKPGLRLESGGVEDAVLLVLLSPGVAGDLCTQYLSRQ
jgi:hypothetical protein